MQTDHNGNPADYLGDGVYVAYSKQRDALELRTGTHYDDDSLIVLEPEVFAALLRFAKNVNFIK